MLALSTSTLCDHVTLFGIHPLGAGFLTGSRPSILNHFSVEEGPEPSMTAQLSFRVSLPSDEDARDGSVLFVTGNHPVLGNWSPKDSLRMSAGDDGTWNVSVPVSEPVSDELTYPTDQAKRRRVNQSLEYRYFIGKAFEDGRVRVRRWESSREPRRVQLEGEGIACIDDFGLGTHGESLDISGGWLQDETMVQIQIHPTKHQPITMQHQGPIKLCFQQQQRDDSGGLLAMQPMRVKVLDLQMGDYEVPEQSDTGVLFEEKKMMVAVGTTDDLEKTVYYIDVYSDVAPTSRLGRCCVSHHMLSDPSQSGCLDLPVIGVEGWVVGNIAAGYTVIRPCDVPSVHSLRRGAELRVWKDVGAILAHRGLGATIGYGSSDVTHPENTIASFKEAVRRGARWVEFDLLMSKDGRLFVNHNVSATVAIQTKKGECSLLHDVSLADFTLAELRSMKIIDPHCPAKANDEVVNEEESLFPTLQEVFDAIPPEVGLDVDIKYTLPCEDGSEHFPYLDRNKYADAILREIYQYGCNRKLVITCLDADLSICLHQKQPHLAVIYCTNGGFTAWPAPLDRRAVSFQASLAFSASEGISIVSHSHPLVEDHSLIVKAKELRVPLFLYGEHTGVERHQQDFRRLGVNGLVVDGISQCHPGTE